MTGPMKLALYAFAAGLVSALAFEPLGWWPLLFVAFAVICELLDRAEKLSQAALDRLPRSASASSSSRSTGSRPPSPSSRRCRASLGWVAVVLVSLYLAFFPALATGVAWRAGRDNRIVLVTGPGRHLDPHRMAAFDLVHRLPVEPGGGGHGADAVDHDRLAHRHLRPVGAGRPARAARCGSNFTRSGSRWC